jgi:hypothetical protein
MEVNNKFHALAALILLYPLGRLQRSERGEQEKNLLPLPGIECLFLGRSACSPVAVPTELSRRFSISVTDIYFTSGPHLEKLTLYKIPTKFSSFRLGNLTSLSWHSAGPYYSYTEFYTIMIPFSQQL